MTEIPHEHDADGNCIDPEGQVVVYTQQPNWSYQSLDIVAHILNGVGGALNAFANAFAFSARELAAAANYRRDLEAWAWKQAEEAERRRLITDDIAALERGETP